MKTPDAGTSDLFDRELSLPDEWLTAQEKRLVGFEQRYARCEKALIMLMEPETLHRWNRRFHQGRLAICETIADRYPLGLFWGDNGTGKTATGQSMVNRYARDHGLDAHLFTLSSRVRGDGRVGQMSSLIDNAFEVVTRQAGKNRVSILVIDEADSLLEARTSSQLHHEDKVAVNTIIQNIDQLRDLRGRVITMLCTNLLHTLDPAIIRRAGLCMEFKRPDADERQALIEMDCGGLDLSEEAIAELVDITGPQPRTGRLGFNFSDFRTRLWPEALEFCFPDAPLTSEILLATAHNMEPSPAINDGYGQKSGLDN